jgi:hypothetical protein
LPTIVVFGIAVFAFMGISLAITATGTARFAAGYSPIVGYVVGAIFDIAKDVLLVAVLALWTRRAPRISSVLCLAWMGLVTYSVFATHATITTAISAIERSGAWKMEVRGNVENELSSLKQQLATLIDKNKNVPRPPNTVRAALAATRVSAGIWKNSRECAAIPESAQFAKECAQVVYLRTELNAAEDYERLSERANELRKSLAETPIIATSDALPAAFAGTLGRLSSCWRHGRSGAIAYYGGRDPQLLWPRRAQGTLQLGRSDFGGRQGRCVLPIRD